MFLLFIAVGLEGLEVAEGACNSFQDNVNGVSIPMEVPVCQVK
jgi:hypothetical protein